MRLQRNNKVHAKGTYKEAQNGNSEQVVAMDLWRREQPL